MIIINHYNYNHYQPILITNPPLVITTIDMDKSLDPSKQCETQQRRREVQEHQTPWARSASKHLLPASARRGADPGGTQGGTQGG